jgi:hypothetical protein
MADPWLSTRRQLDRFAPLLGSLEDSLDILQIWGPEISQFFATKPFIAGKYDLANFENFSSVKI